MPISSRELIAKVTASISEMDVHQVNDAIQSGEGGMVLDIRERDEFSQGYIPTSVHVPRGFLELRIEKLARNHDEPIILYCAGGIRSALAARSLEEMGYTGVVSMSGGFAHWKNAGYKIVQERLLSEDEMQRFSRHIMLPEIGEEGQGRLLDAKVLLVGAGGLGCPAGQYLAAAGVGTLGIVDADVVDLSNLQRQVLHGTSDVGRPKVISAMESIAEMNPGVDVRTYREHVTSENVMDIIADYDIIVNGCDNFPTRYLLSDAAVFTGKTLVDGSIFGFEGQATVFKPNDGPCYRCLYPVPPPPGLVPSCDENGVLGVLPGIVGLVQSTETLKLILELGEPLVGRLLTFDATTMNFRTLKARHDPGCPVCGESPTITELIDYEQFCGLPPRREAAYSS